MSNQHTLMNVPFPSGSPTARLCLSPFPRHAFPEISTETPLDLNSSERHIQNSSKALTAFGPDTTCQQGTKEFVTSPNAEKEMESQMVTDIISDNLETPPEKATYDIVPTKISQRSRCHWSHNEVMALFNAKVAEVEKYNENVENEKTSKKMRISAERWDEIAEFCKSMGSNKLASQCKDKWERIWSAFKKITDWEKQPTPGKRSFWVMAGEEREKEGFPRVFDRELFDAMSARFGSVKSADLSTIVIESSTMDQTDLPANSGDEPMVSQIVAVEETPSVVNDQPTILKSQKQKSTPRRSTRKMPTVAQKKSDFNINQAEENDMPGTTKDQGSKSKGPDDLNERKLVLEERKLKLAERRFQLEEKKLEATIEIGKGLIASMERMTQTISSLSSFPPS